MRLNFLLRYSIFLFLLIIPPRLMAKEHYLVYCFIQKQSGEIIRSFNGLRCLYLDDGRVIISNTDFLEMHDKNMNLLWKKKIHTHHHLNLSLDKTKILVMTSSIRERNKQPIRYDRLSIFNMKGVELESFDFYENKEQLEAITPPFLAKEWTNTEIGDFSKVFKIELEASHANSFYEIDSNALSSKIPAFSKGNYIVNSADNVGIFIIDSHLKKVLWHLPFKHAKENTIYHDVRVTKSGKISIFHNQAGPKHSEVKLYDPVTDTFSTYLLGSPPESFASLECCGSAEILPNGNVLTTVDINGGHVVEMTKEGKTLWSFPNPHINHVTKKPHIIQGVRLEDLSQFLINNTEL